MLPRNQQHLTTTVIRTSAGKLHNFSRKVIDSIGQYQMFLNVAYRRLSKGTFCFMKLLKNFHFNIKLSTFSYIEKLSWG